MSDKPPSFTLAGQVALVTGSAQGIGAACAIALAEAGADIILGLRHIETGQALVKQIQEIGREVLPVQMNVSRLDEIAAAVASGHAHFGHIEDAK